MQSSKLRTKVGSEQRSHGGMGEAALNAPAAPTEDTRQLQEVPVLSNITLSLVAGRSTLLLAPRAHGKSSLLRLLCGRLPSGGVRGQVTYGGYTGEQIHKEHGVHLHRLCRYIDQTEWHLPHLTVRQALTFAATTQTCPTPSLADCARIESILSSLGLSHCGDTPIGDTQVRGISGGEKRRVAIAEALLSDARVLCCDEVTSGLDSARAAGVATLLSKWAKDTQGIVIAALLQPTPETMAAFDDVILMHHGRIIFHGPVHDLPAYAHQYLGVPSDVQSTVPVPVPGEGREGSGGAKAGLAGRVVDVLSHPLDHIPAASSSTPGSLHPCCKSLMAPWQGYIATFTTSAEENPSSTSILGQRQESGKASILAITGPDVDKYRKCYPRGWVHATLSILWRDWLYLCASWTGVAARVVSTLFIGMVLGTGFRDLALHDVGSKLGLCMFMMAHIATVTFQDIPRVVTTKNVTAAQYSHGQFPALAPALSSLLLSLPVTMVETLAYCASVYFAAGMDPSAPRFLFFTALLATLSATMATFFRMLAFGASSADAVQLSLGLVLTIMELSAGYLVSPTKLGWWRWLYDGLPYGFVMRSLAWNEFHAPRYSHTVLDPTPDSPDGTAQYGHVLLRLYGINTGPEWPGRTFAYLLGFLAGCTLLSAYYLASFARPSPELQPHSPAVTLAITGGKVDAGQGSEDAGKTAQEADLVVRTVNVLATLPPLPSNTSCTSPTSSSPHTVGLEQPLPVLKHVLQLAPATLAFQDVRYSVRIKGKGMSPSTTRVLLHGIHGYARPGTLTALMGGSGAGKTTLLDVLAGRKTSGTITGSIMINGQPVTPAQLRTCTSYCEQADEHDRWATVREALRMSATLRAAHRSKEKIEQVVQAALQDLDLLTDADRLIGTPGSPSGLSLSARKRLTLGVEVVASKAIVYLDEPTSGLDNTTARTVMECMRRIAASGRTVVATIHQPSQAIFESFDSVLLLSPGGFQAYCGPREGVVPHLSQAGNDTLPFVHGMNPATWMMQVTCGSAQGEPDTPAPTPDVVPASLSSLASPASGSSESQTVDLAEVTVADVPLDSRFALGHALHAAFQSSAAYTSLIHELSMCITPAPSFARVESFIHTPPFTSQVWQLVLRYVRMGNRNSEYTVGRVSSMIFIALLVGLIYFRLNTSDLSGTQSLIGLILTAAGMLAILPAQTYLAVAMEGIPVMERETAAGMYGHAAYTLANSLYEWAAMCIQLPPAIAVCYFMVGLQAGEGGGQVFGHHVLMIILLAAWLLGIIQVGIMVVANMEQVQTILLALLMLCQVYSGLYIPGPAISNGWKWFHAANPMAYTAEALVSVQLHCTDRAAGGPCPVMAVPIPGGVAEVDREMFVTDVFGLRYARRWDNIGYTAVWVIGLHMLYMLAAARVKRTVR